MITEIFLNIVFSFINLLIGILRGLGTVSPDSAITGGITAISSYLTPLNAILPLSTIISILLFELIFEGLYFTYKLIRWGYSKVPGVN